MLKHKKIFLLSLLVPVFIITSCKKPKEDYPIHRDTKDIHLTVTGDYKKEYKSGEKLNIDSLDITVNGTPKADLTRINKKEDVTKEKSYFVCANGDLPTNSIIGSDYKASTNVESAKFNFYIATVIKIGNEYNTYVSQKFTITIKNDDALKPWVWYVVTGVVVFGVVGMVMFVRHRKLKEEK